MASCSYLSICYIKFRRFHKIAKSHYFFRHVRPSVRKKQIDYHYSDFDKIQYLKNFRISVEINQFLVKSGKNKGTLIKDICIFATIIRCILFRMEMFHTQLIENIKTHISYSNNLFRNSCHVSDKVEKKHDRTRNVTNYNMHFACWITKASDTQ